MDQDLLGGFGLPGVPLVAGVGTALGCEAVTAGAGTAGVCTAAGFAAWGYVHNAINSHTVFSVDNVKAGLDAGAFGGCLAMTALTCGGAALTATGFDFYATHHDTGEWDTRGLARGLVFDALGFGFGKYAEWGADAIKSARNVGFVGGSTLRTAGAPSLTVMSPTLVQESLLRLSGHLSQTTVNNLNYIMNYDYGTQTCGNPFPSLGPSYCQG